MKKISVFLFLYLFLFMAIPSHAVQIAGGAKMWIVDWDPFFKEPLTAAGWLNNPVIDFDLAPTIFAGPSLSLIIGDIGLATSFNYGEFHGDISISGTEKSSGNAAVHQSIITVTRYDIDLSLSYRLVSQLRIFAGYKIQSYNIHAFNRTGIITNDAYAYVQSADMVVSSVLTGPGAGLGYTLNFGNFFVGASVAGVFLSGKYTPDSTQEWDVGKSTSKRWLSENWGMDISSVGITIEPQVGFRAGDRSILLLGFKYQSMDSELKSSRSDERLWDDDQGNPVYKTDSKDTFIGGSLSISLLF